MTVLFMVVVEVLEDRGGEEVVGGKNGTTVCVIISVEVPIVMVLVVVAPL